MKYKPLLVYLFLLSATVFGQSYESKYAVFDRKIVLVNSIGENSDVVRVVPKGDPIQIMEKVRGPIYKAQYKDAKGYLISFNLENRFTGSRAQSRTQHSVTSAPRKLYVTLSRKTYITKKTDYKMVIAVPKHETLQVIGRVKRGKYLVRYRNHTGYCDLGSFNVKDKVSLAYLDIMKVDRSSDSKRLIEQLPPIIKIDDVSFSKNVLCAGESNELIVTLSNSGMGDAKSVYGRLSSDDTGVEYPLISPFPKIQANGGVASMRMIVDGNPHLSNGMATLNIEVVEPLYKVAVPKRQLRFETEELARPELIITHHEVSESRSAYPNNRIDRNEMVDLSFTIQNIGKANADKLEIDVLSDQVGVTLLGLVRDQAVLRQNPGLKTILPGEEHRLSFRYFLNSEFLDQDLRFKVRATDRINGFNFSAELIFPINSEMLSDPYTIILARNGATDRNVLPSQSEYVEDVDHDIPGSNKKQTSTYALIIGNEDYKSRQRTLSVEQNAEFAVNDAEVFRYYCQKTLGIPPKQIKILRNATAAEISQGLAWINNLSKIEEGKAKLIFYYSGHGMPDEETKSPIIVPVDVSANNLEYGIQLSDAYASLIEHPARQVTVFLDACFSGGGKNQGFTASKGIKVKANKNVIIGNMVVFSSSSGDETSSVYGQTKHGYFTYFLLKKLKESKGNIDYDDLSSYLINSVRKETGLNGIVQTPQVRFSRKVENDWKRWKLK